MRKEQNFDQIVEIPDTLTVTKFLDNKKYISVDVPGEIIKEMKDKGIMPKDVDNDLVFMRFFGTGVYHICWCVDLGKIKVYSPRSSVVTEEEI